MCVLVRMGSGIETNINTHTHTQKENIHKHTDIYKHTERRHIQYGNIPYSYPHRHSDITHTDRDV